jgi:micrococcal nuclease
MYNYNIEVTRVIDGDTVDCIIDLGFKISTKYRIRLAGIDTPETRTTNAKEKIYGFEAKVRLQELLTEYTDANDNLILNPQVSLKSHGLGKFGRVLGTLYVGDVDINQRLIDEGFAIEYQGERKIETPELLEMLDAVRSCQQ